MSFKLLNLDDFEKVERTLVIGGTRYHVEEMSVEDLVKTQVAIKKISNGEVKDPMDQIELMVEIISSRFPEAGKEVFRKLSIGKLNAIYEWLSMPAEEIVKAATEAEEKGKKLDSAAEQTPTATE